MKNIIVLYGGKSCEHDVSVITGVLTLNSIDKKMYNVIPVYVSKKGEWFTGKILNNVEVYKNLNFKKLTNVCFNFGSNGLYSVKKGKQKLICNVDCAVICSHGKNGEDGTLHAICSACNVAVVGSGLFSSSTAIDKYFTKIVLKGLNVKCLPDVKVEKSNFYSSQTYVIKLIESKFNYPVIIKPTGLGSSIGVYVSHSSSDLIENLIKSFRYDVKVIVEPCLKNFLEVNCACYKNEKGVVVSQCEQPILSGEILSLADKYAKQSSSENLSRIFPANIPLQVSEKIQKITKKVYEKCEFSGVIRIDYLIYNGEVYLNEINSVPGSMAYYLFANNFNEYTEILTSLISTAINEKFCLDGLNYEYFSKVLNVKGAKGGIKR